MRPCSRSASPVPGWSSIRQEMPRAASSSWSPRSTCAPWCESSPFHMIMHGCGAVARRLGEVGRQRRALVRDRDPGGRRVEQVEGLCAAWPGSAGRSALRSGSVRCQHPLGLAQVVGGPDVAAGRRCGRAPAFSATSAWPSARGRSTTAVQARRKSACRRPRRAGGLADRPAGAVDLVDEAAAVERGDDAEVPDVVAGEVLEHRVPQWAVGRSGGARR